MLPHGASGKESTYQCSRQETMGLSLGWENPMEKEMATHFSILAWKIPWQEPGGLQFMGLQRMEMTEHLSAKYC